MRRNCVAGHDNCCMEDEAWVAAASGSTDCNHPAAERMEKARPYLEALAH